MALTQENVTTRFNVVGTADFRLVPLGGRPAGARRTRCARSPATARPTSSTASAFAILVAEQRRRAAAGASARRPASCSGWRSPPAATGPRREARRARRGALAGAARSRHGAGALLYGADAMRVALKRAALVAALIGPEGAAEMRLTRIAAAELRRDPAALLDALKAVGFFPGPRVVLVEDAGDAPAAPLSRARSPTGGPATRGSWSTAGELGAGSALRKAFEAAPHRRGDRRLRRPARPRGDRGGAGQGRARPRRPRGDGRSRGAGARARPRRLRAVPGEARALQARRRRRRWRPRTSPPVAPPAPEARSTRCSTSPPRAGRRLAAELRRLGARGGSATGARPSPPAGTSARCTPPPARRTGRRRRSAAPGRRSSARGARAWPAQARALGPGGLERALGWIIDTDLALRSGRPPPGPRAGRAAAGPHRHAAARLTPRVTGGASPPAGSSSCRSARRRSGAAPRSAPPARRRRAWRPGSTRRRRRSRARRRG